MSTENVGPNPDDFHDRLLHARHDGGFGQFDHVYWSTYSSGNPQEDAVRYITLHESLHDELSSSTAYGSLLHVFAHVGKQGNAIFSSLIDRCRTAHETYATCVALLVLERLDSAEDILQGCDDYFPYVELGRRLCDGLDHSSLRFQALTSVIRACMQVPLDSVLEAGLASFQPAQILHREYPNERLKYLARLIDKDFWPSFCHKHDWRGEHQLELLSQWDEDATRTLAKQMYEIVADLLRSGGFSPLSFDGHQKYTEELTRQLRELIGDEHPVLLRAPANETPFELMAETYANERLIVVSRKHTGFAIELADMSDKTLIDLTSGADPDEHFYVVSRSVSKMFDQYDFDDESKALLLSRSLDYVLCLRRSRIEGGVRFVENFLLSTVEAVERLLRHRRRPLIVSLSMRHLERNRSGALRTLLSAVHENHLSVLIDASPYAMFNHLSQNHNRPIVYAVISVTVGEAVHEVFAFWPSGQRTPVFLCPCSAVVNSAFVFFLQEYVSVPQAFVNDGSFLTTLQWPIRVVLGHLFREEPYFDFRT